MTLDRNPGSIHKVTMKSSNHKHMQGNLLICSHFFAQWLLGRRWSFWGWQPKSGAFQKEEHENWRYIGTEVAKCTFNEFRERLLSIRLSSTSRLVHQKLSTELDPEVENLVYHFGQSFTSTLPIQNNRFMSKEAARTLWPLENEISNHVRVEISSWIDGWGFGKKSGASLVVDLPAIFFSVSDGTFWCVSCNSTCYRMLSAAGELPLGKDAGK